MTKKAQEQDTRVDERSVQDASEISAVFLRGLQDRSPQRDRAAIESAARLIEDLAYDVLRLQARQSPSAGEARSLDMPGITVRDGLLVNDAENQDTPRQQLAASIAEVVQEMRTIQMVAGQCSVEAPDSEHASMAAAEAERCRKWADWLSRLTSSE